MVIISIIIITVVVILKGAHVHSKKYNTIYNIYLCILYIYLILCVACCPKTERSGVHGSITLYRLITIILLLLLRQE